MTTSHLGFNVAIGRNKPENIINTAAACPFCNRDALTDIIDVQNDFILLKNKYPVLENALQTVLIETQTCDHDFSAYPKEYLYSLMRFGIGHWLAMIDSREFKTVLFFKNHGPLSGGTIRHPHMQIIGLRDIEPAIIYKPDDFAGLAIDSRCGVVLNISTTPHIGFAELNIITTDNSRIETIADYIQTAVHYLTHRRYGACKSYNLFFYLINDLIHVKIMPRFATSPLFIGYNISLIPTNITSIAQEIKALYF